MKLITAIVKPFKLDDVKDALSAVGVQGIAVAERAYQKAVQYARERVQSRPAAPVGERDDHEQETQRAVGEGVTGHRDGGSGRAPRHLPSLPAVGEPGVDSA